MKIDLSISANDWLHPRLTLVGGPGIGKTSFGVSAPKPVFIMGEDGCGAPVPRIPKLGRLTHWDQAIEAVQYLLKEDHDRETVVVDVINSIADLAKQHICTRDYGGLWKSKRGQEGFNAWGYGDKDTCQEFKRFLHGLDLLREKRKMWVILLAHEGLHRHGNVFGDDFQKIGGAVHKLIWEEILRWSDQVGHATKDFIAVKKEGEKAAKPKGDNKRILYFEGGPGRDAKARAGYEMPASMKFSYKTYELALLESKTKYKETWS